MNNNTSEETMPLFDQIRQWAKDRNLIEGATRQAQMLKLFEEGGELAGAIARGKEDVVKDSIGDMVVVLTIVAAQSGLTIEECIAAAYDEIKDRKGRMVDGVFVKEESADG
jgi:NTP pyrophosphatase (non-canonical NTP hydrolase)